MQREAIWPLIIKKSNRGVFLFSSNLTGNKVFDCLLVLLLEGLFSPIELDS